MRLAPLLVVLAAGCRAAPPAPPAASGEPLASALPPADSAPPIASASAAPPAPAWPPHADGCWGVELPVTGAETLSALGQRCAPGFAPLFEPPRVTARGEWVALPALKEGACVRIATAGQATIELVGPRGPLASDRGGDFALSPAVCPRPGEPLRLRVVGGTGPALVQAWATAGR